MCFKLVIGGVVSPHGRRSAHDCRVVAQGADAVAVVTLIHLPRHSPLFLLF